MFDFEIARYLYRVHFLLLYLHNSTYKSRAYFKAALAVDGYEKAILNLYRDNNLQSLPFIGISIEKNIKEVIETGNLKLIDELLGDTPYSVFQILEHSNISNSLLKKIFNVKIFSFDELSKKINDNNGYFTKKEIDKINKEIHNFYENLKFQYAHVKELADELISQLKSNNYIKNISTTGSLRLADDVLKQGEIICSSELSIRKLAKKIALFDDIEVMEVTKQMILVERFSINFTIYVVEDNEFYYKLAVTTGNQKYSNKFEEVPKAEYLGLLSEEAIFEKAKIHYVTPRLRGLSEDIKPSTIKNENNVVNEIYGDLHLHTNWSDGLHTIEIMSENAMRMGYKYIAITDHSQSLKPSGMSELTALTQISTIRNLNEELGQVHILSGIEVDIKADGTLDYPDSILEEFDIVIASIHSHFNQSPSENIERIRRALQNKYVNIFAHPTGRLLGRPGKISVQRDQIIFDFDELLKICKDNEVALEINCFPERFDLCLENVIRAVNFGVNISIGTDSHSKYHMETTKYAVEMLQEARVNSEFVLNCKNIGKLNNFLNKKKDKNSGIIENIDIEAKFKNYDYYFSNNIKLSSGISKAVGIDLTGSENKASGFALLEGSKVSTGLIFTDDEMIQKILQIKPTVVSIDSPLSLPEGRCCGDKTCECSKHGIMRYCELTLKRFGIGVYPCLIDSMVNLTMRGMRLAQTLRSFNINVIESYPGVAQDLLHIPRKRKGIELLIKGLTNFGILNIKDNISHDEADAITSALVGCFYLNDFYVAMGNEVEDYLIVPRLNSDLFPRKMVIGLTGKISAGKTTVAEYLRFKYGFKYMSYSKIIKEMHGVNDRENLQRIGLEISKDQDTQKALSLKMINEMDDASCYVIDGLRQPEDFKTMAECFDDKFLLINIDAKPNLRYKRYKKLHSEIMTIDDFQRIDEHKVENQINLVSHSGSICINNNSSYKFLMEQIDTVMSTIINKN